MDNLRIPLGFRLQDRDADENAPLSVSCGGKGLAAGYAAYCEEQRRQLEEAMRRHAESKAELLDLIAQAHPIALRLGNVKRREMELDAREAALDLRHEEQERRECDLWEWEARLRAQEGEGA